MNRILQRVFGQLMDKVVTEKLAQSKTFQRAALKTHEHVQRAQGHGKRLMEDVKDQARIAADEAAAAGPGKASFASELKKEVEKNLEGLARFAGKTK